MKFDLSSGSFIDRDSFADRRALDDGETKLSWREFECAVMSWVDRALTAGARKDSPVLIRGHKEAAFFVAMAGCLVIGAPFVPVDAIYPDERAQRIRNISGARLTYSAQNDAFQISDEVSERFLEERDLAYIIFTSGSTGEPKGVQIGRESVQELVDWMQDHFQLGDAPVFMNQAPFSFDLSIYEVMATLALGGCCVLNSRQSIQDSESFLRRQSESGITTWVSTPSFAYQQFLHKNFTAAHLPTLSTFLFCGEPLTPAIAKGLQSRFPSSRIINTYGPTEATVATTWVVIDEEILATHNAIPVGRSKPGSHVFLDADTQEICIAGKHVMRGYLNRSDLNTSKLFEYRGHRAFRTGDLGEIDSTGMIFCRGRIDDQIKLHGYRIELSEIDRVFQNLPEVSNAAVTALKRPDGTAIRLVAFIVPSAAAPIADKEALIPTIKSSLARLLPEYMVPSEILMIDELPLSVNHKIDRKRLADLYRSRA